MAQSFEGQISDWVKETLSRSEGVFKESAQEVFSIAQEPVGEGGGNGNMPIDTGFLRASLRTGINGNITLDQPSNAESEEAKKGDKAVFVTIVGARLGDAIEGTWTAEYARARHYGSAPGNLWRDKAAQQWQEIVARISREAEARNS